MVSGSNGRKKDLNFELNLLPVFDVLSVCICFLLMTAVWIQVGQLSVSQATGGQSKAETVQSPTVWIQMNDQADAKLILRNVPGQDRQITIRGQNGEPAVQAIAQTIESLKTSFEVKMSMIIPAKTTVYKDLIRIMESLSKMGIKDVGISPL